MREASEVEEWSTFFRCVHRCCSTCMGELLLDAGVGGLFCHYCREPIPDAERALIIKTSGGAANSSTDEEETKQREEGKIDVAAVELVEKELGVMKVTLRGFCQPRMEV